MVLRPLDINIQKEWLDPYLTLYTKIKRKRVKDLDVRAKTEDADKKKTNRYIFMILD